MTTLVTSVSVLGLGLHVNLTGLILVVVPSLFVFSSLGALMSVSVKEVFEAQTLANFPRFLMMFLSGVLYPISAMPISLQYVACLLPLTYTVDGLRNAFMSGGMVLTDSLVLTAFTLTFILPAVRLLERRFI